MLDILVLGSGCKNCHTVEERAQQAVKELGIQANVRLVTDVPTIMRFGVMHTPGIVIDDKVVSVGRVPAVSQIKSLIQTAQQTQSA